MRDVQRDVEDAVPYGGETVGRLRDGGRGKPLPYGDDRTRVRDVQRDVEDAVPYGSETAGGLRDGGRGKPLPYGYDRTRARDVQRDVEDAVPYGSETVGGLRDGGRGKPPLRVRSYPGACPAKAMRGAVKPRHEKRRDRNGEARKKA